MATEEEAKYEIVIAGGGICGLATALVFHRKGIKCLVLERSESLRSTGAAIGIMPNGWRALHQLGVASILRQLAYPITGAKDIWLDKNKQRDISFISSQSCCLRRSDLIDTLYNALPPDMVKFGHQLVSLKMNPETSYPVLQLQDGSSIAAKVLIGCDGAKSVVADFLELKSTRHFARCSVRGLANYPNGHPFTHEFVRMRRNNILVGRTPIDNKLVYWFVAHPLEQADTTGLHDTELTKKYTLELIKFFPEEIVQMVNYSDPDSFSFTRLRYRAPWDLLLGKFRKGTVTVAGDAMHVMGPFLGQGGSAGLEDAIVVARNLAKELSSISTDPRSIGEALDNYVNERRMRIVRLSTQTYLAGRIPQVYGKRLEDQWKSLFLDYNFLEGNLSPEFARAHNIIGSLAHNCVECPQRVVLCRRGQRRSSECAKQNNDGAIIN